MEVPSNMLPLGTQAPDFTLPDTTCESRMTSLADVRGDKATLVMFISNHCPYVKHVQGQIASLAGEYQSRGVGVVAISSNDIVDYPADAPDKMAMVAASAGYAFPYLYDESQGVARAYDAACTPDFYLFDADLTLVYRGRLDGATPGNSVPVTGEELRAALESVLRGEAVSQDQKPSLGCNIKWRG